MNNSFKYVNGFNAVRFFAVFLVIIGHWGLYYPSGTVQFDILKIFIPWGKFGLPFLLVLSGFLTSSVLFKARLDMETSDSKISIAKNFLVRRALRLLPAYTLMIIVLYCLRFPLIVEHPLYYLTHTSNVLIYITQKPNGLIHVWSLSLQEQFYLLLPWVILYSKEKWLKYIVLCGMGVGVITKYYAMFALGKGFTFLPFHFFEALGLGVLYAYYIYIGKKGQFERVIKLMLPVLLYFGWQMGSYRGSMAGIIYERSMWSYMGLCIIIFTVNNKNAFLKKYFFENTVINYFGKISYGIYLYHYVIGSYFDNYYSEYLKTHHLPFIVGNFVTMYIVKLAIVFKVASLSYKYFETPIIALKTRFNYLKKNDPKTIEIVQSTVLTDVSLRA